MTEAARDPYAMTWQRKDYPELGTVEYHGSSEYHSAVVTRSAVGGGTFQARVTCPDTADRYSPYLRTLPAAKAWAARYGRPKRKRVRALPGGSAEMLRRNRVSDQQDQVPSRALG
jgi:hypothetical protein